MGVAQLQRQLQGFKTGYSMLESFVKLYDIENIDHNTVFNDYPLGRFVEEYRHKASKPQQQQLDQLGFIWDVYENNFNSYCSLLEEYSNEFGHTMPGLKESYKGVNLGIWCNNIRGQRATLSDSMVQRLNSLGFVWSPSDLTFETNLKLCLEFLQDNDYSIRKRDVYKGKNIGLWYYNLVTGKTVVTDSKLEILKKYDALFLIGGRA